VSVGGLLDKKCGNNIHENPKYGRWVKEEEEEERRQGKESA
jgi:hypothetical protein